ncbi:MAG: indole-3-glycerol phosphate synthase TrpC [Thermodesulfobacteriota bacterium]
MNPLLHEIVEAKRWEAGRLRESAPRQWERERRVAVRDFRGALCRGDRVHLIAEIKYASPSAGRIRWGPEACVIAKGYQGAGASAISLITDREFFRGDIGLLPQVKAAVTLPVLRKDFIIEETQVLESYAYGADAILLIARILPLEDLKRLTQIAGRLGMAVLTEVHDEEDLEKACRSGADIIGINNRNLDTFEVDFSTTVRLAPRVPRGSLRVSESGVKGEEDIRILKELGFHAVLVGTILMKSTDPAEKAAGLVRAGGRHGEGEDLRHHQP